MQLMSGGRALADLSLQVGEAIDSRRRRPALSSAASSSCNLFQNGDIKMFGTTHLNSASRLAGAMVLGAAFLGSVLLGGPARADSVPLTIANTDNRTVKVTAYDMNAGGGKIF